MTRPDAASPPGAERGTDASAEQLQADIARTREQLGHTVEQLSGKLDVKSRTRDQFGASRRRVTEQARIVRVRVGQYAAGTSASVCDDRGKPKPVVVATAAAFSAMAAGAVAMAIWARSR